MIDPLCDPTRPDMKSTVPPLSWNNSPFQVGPWRCDIKAYHVIAEVAREAAPEASEDDPLLKASLTSASAPWDAAMILKALPKTLCPECRGSGKSPNKETVTRKCPHCNMEYTEEDSCKVCHGVGLLSPKEDIPFGDYLLPRYSLEILLKIGPLEISDPVDIVYCPKRPEGWLPMLPPEKPERRDTVFRWRSGPYFGIIYPSMAQEAKRVS